MRNIQKKIKQLQTNLSELRYDLHLKQNSIPNLSDLIECEILWKSNPMAKDEIHENSPNQNTMNSYEQCLISFLMTNDKNLSIDQLKNKKKRRICVNCGKC